MRTYSRSSRTMGDFKKQPWMAQMSHGLVKTPLKGAYACIYIYRDYVGPAGLGSPFAEGTRDSIGPFLWGD